MSATTPSPERAVSRRPDDEVSLWEVLAVLLRRRRTIVVTTLLVGMAAAAFAQFRPLTYTTSASFRPQGSEGNASQLAALASQFGVNVGGMGGEEASPAFYQELLTSREILSRLLGVPFPVDGAQPILLKDLLDIQEASEAERDEEALEWLVEEAVSVSTGRETGTVTIAVETEWPAVSLEIARRLLDEVSKFNLETRQSKAASEREFIEERVLAAERELEQAEEALRGFLEANRQWQNAPLLVFRHDALEREVSLRQSVLTTLVQSYEQARIQEVRDTPVITLVQTPYLPQVHDPRRRVITTLLGLILGAMLGLVLAFVVEAFSRPADGDPAREDFETTWMSVRRSIPFMGGRG